MIGEYRKAMLQSAHIIVINSKNLLDSIDQVRLRLINSNGPQSISPKRSLLTKAVQEEGQVDEASAASPPTAAENSLSVSATSLDTT